MINATLFQLLVHQHSQGRPLGGLVVAMVVSKKFADACYLASAENYYSVLVENVVFIDVV